MPPDLVVMDDALRNSLVKHLFVPLLQSLGLGDLLVWRMAVEDIVIPLTWWAGPDMPGGVPKSIRKAM